MNFQTDPSPIQWIAGFLLALVALLIQKDPRSRPIGVGGLVLAALGLALYLSGIDKSYSPAVVLAGLGCAVSGLLPRADQELVGPTLILLLFGAIVCGSPGTQVAASSYFLGSGALLLGLGAGGLMLGRGASAGSIGILLLTSGAADALARSQLGGVHASPGLLMVGGLAACLLVISGVRQLLGANADWKPLALAVVLFAAVPFLIHYRVFLHSEAGLTAIAGAAIAGILVWALPSSEESSLASTLLGAILMIAVGTAAFGEARGLGMATAALSALAVGIVAQKPRVVAVLSPLAVLAIFRAFGVAFPDAARALDIGQHYGMIGVLAGLLASLLVAEVASWEHRSATGLAIASAGLAAAFSPLLIGSKGAVGLLVGLGLGGVVGLLARRTQEALAASVALLGALLIGYPLLRDRLDLTRAEKLPMLAGVGLVVLITGVAAAMLVRPTTENPAESA